MSLGLTFDDITLKVLPVTIANRKYELREASGAAANRYRFERSKCYKYNRETDTNELIGNLNDTQAYLVSQCLFDLEENKFVSKDMILSWPDRVQIKLFFAAQRISGFVEEDDTLEGLKERQKELSEDLAEVNRRIEQMEDNKSDVKNS